MQAEPLQVSGAWVFTPAQWPDSRGVFLEWFREQSVLDAVGHPFVLRQVNHSVSSARTLRGVHFADVPPSQAKYVYVSHGAAVDFVVDLRVGSPTFGTVDAVRLDDRDRRAVYVGEGLGHAVVSLTDDVHLNYLVTQPYSPSREHGVHPFGEGLDLREHPQFPAGPDPLLSERDAAAPSLAEARAGGLLPAYERCLELYASLRGGQGQ